MQNASTASLAAGGLVSQSGGVSTGSVNPFKNPVEVALGGGKQHRRHHNRRRAGPGSKGSTPGGGREPLFCET